MGEEIKVRAATRDDVEAIRALAVANDMFPGEMLDGMMESYFAGADELWFVTEGTVAGAAYAVPEKLTNGTWNQLMIAVAPDQHGKGAGKLLMRHLEQTVGKLGGRMIIIDTSGTEAFAGTRSFYRAIGYEQVACVTDFWDDGDDKITFRRLLPAGAN